jgi:hypothetical protein
VSLLVTALLASTPAYIHFPPGDLPKYCKDSSDIRVLEVAKFDADGGVIVFDVADTVKKTNPQAKGFKQVIDPKAKGAQPIFDWVKKGKKAVLFSIEGPARTDVPGAVPMACGYVVIDDFWYSVDYNVTGEHWAFLRADPHLSAVYHGEAEKLVPLVKDILAGKKVDVPTKKADKVPTKEERFEEVNGGLIKNRGLKK